MTNKLEMNRRQFVVATAAVGGGLALGVGEGVAATANMMAEPWKAPPVVSGVEINAWILIAPDDTILIRVGQAEMGQGVFTSMPMIVCEELQCDWSKVKAEYADANRDAKENNVYKRMGTGGSNSVRSSREYLQQAGASARERLKAAAAAQWGVPATEVEAKDSKLTHKASGRTLRYGEVAARAALVKLEKEPGLKTPDQYTFMGKATVKRVDTPLKVDGSAVFGIDVKLPGLLHGAIKMAPVFGAKLKKFDAAAAKAMPGVIDVVELGKEGQSKHTVATYASHLEAAVVVVANSYWQAKTALDAMPIEWDEGNLAKTSTDDYVKQAMAALGKEGGVGRKDGDAPAALKSASKVYDFTYETPWLEHATMEPFNATAQVRADRVDVWVPTQNPQNARLVASQQAGVKEDQVYVSQTFLGGGFGRRTIGDDVRQAVEVSKAMGGRPVKVVWSREETMRHGTYRNFAAARFQASLGADGMPTAIYIRYAGHSTPIQRQVPPKDNVDIGQLRLLVDSPYQIPNFQIEFTPIQTHIPSGAFRGPAANQNSFKIESFVDELAIAAGKSPLEYRLKMLQGYKDPSAARLLTEVAAKSGFGKKLPKGQGQGIAIGAWPNFTPNDGTFVATVATVDVSQGGEVKVKTVDIAYDMGNVVNFADTQAQWEGATAMGVGGTLYEEITVRNGRVVEGNFDDYRILRIDEMPKVNSYPVLSGGNRWGGVGEPGLVALVPAITNAIYAATGKRVRSLPLKNHDLTWS